MFDFLKKKKKLLTELNEEEKKTHTYRALVSAILNGYIGSSDFVSLNKEGLDLIKPYLPDYPSDEVKNREISDIIGKVLEGKVIKEIEYFKRFESSLIEGKFKENLFYQKLSASVGDILPLLKNKETHPSIFHLVLGTYFLKEAEKFNLIKREYPECSEGVKIFPVYQL